MDLKFPTPSLYEHKTELQLRGFVGSRCRVMPLHLLLFLCGDKGKDTRLDLSCLGSHSHSCVNGCGWLALILRGWGSHEPLNAGLRFKVEEIKSLVRVVVILLVFIRSNNRYHAQYLCQRASTICFHTMWIDRRLIIIQG